MLDRLFYISRSRKPWILNMSEFYLSLSTGVFFIIHVKYYSPLIYSQGNQYSIYSILFSLTVVNLLKFIVITPFYIFWNVRIKKNQGNAQRGISFPKLIYPTIIKLATYLSIIFLASVIRYLTFALAVACALIFILSLHFCNASNKIINILWKGRPYSSNKIKIIIVYLLVLLGLLLQPFQYIFIFELHFEIFIIFTTCLLIISYFYLHKLAATVTGKSGTTSILVKEIAIECLCLVCLIVYYILLQDYGMTIAQQFQYMLSNALLLVFLFLFNLFYQLILLEIIQKIAFNRLIISQTTGLLWYNIYYMIQYGIQIKLYISVIILSFILVLNLQLFSERNMKTCLNLLQTKKKRKKIVTASEVYMKNEQNGH